MKLAKNNHQKILEKFLIIAIPLISFFWSCSQGVYIFDSYHWGLIAHNAISFLNGKELYNEIFVHYGPLTTIINAAILKLFDKNLFFIFIFYSFFYSLGILLISLTTIKITSSFYLGLLSSLIIFFVHPVIIAPWHNYLLFLIITFYLFLKISFQNKYSEIVLILGILVSETFLLPCFIIILFSNFYEFFFYQKKFHYKNAIYRTLIFFSIFFLYILWIYLTGKLGAWINTLKLGSVFLEIFNLGYLDLIILFLKNLVNYSSKLFVETQWLVFLIIFLINFLLTFNLIFILIKKKDYLIENKQVYLISFVSLVFSYNAIHNFSIFKFSTGLVIGIIPIIYLLKNIRNSDFKVFCFIILFFLTLNCLRFTQNNSNIHYVLDYKKKEFYNNKKFKYFVNQKWSENDWNNLELFLKNTEKIKIKCNIKNFYNLTKHAFYILLANENFIINQKIPWFEYKDRYYMNRYYTTLFNYYDKNFFIRFNKNIENKDILFVAYRENFPKISNAKENINLDDHLEFRKLPNSKNLKNVILVFPKGCL
jgi:hypothetical protein